MSSAATIGPGFESELLLSTTVVTTELREVHAIAKNMAIGVLNAKAIAARAGDAASGFQPITDSIHELAQEVAELVRQITDQSLRVSRLSVQLNHSLNSQRRFRKAWRAAELEQAEHLASLEPAVGKIEKRVSELTRSYREDVVALCELLGQIKRNVRAARIIATSSRVEAVRALDFQTNLEVVAEDLEVATQAIGQKVETSRKRLEGVLEGLPKGVRA